MKEALEIFTIVAGGVAATCAFCMSVYFARHKEGIGRAIALDKAAECVNMMVILTFAIAYYFDLFVKMPIEMAAALRIAAISATTFSSLHLAWQTKKVLESDSNDIK